MGKRILITSTDLMMVQFLIPHVENLAENGFEVEIACSEVGGRMDEIRKKLEGVVEAVHVVRLVRSPVSLGNFRGYGDMKRVIESGHYDIIWTNEPVMGVVTRLAAQKARKNGTKVLYMVHGFHFHNGGPKFDWAVYYPIERLMASKADLICTINKEDYGRAKRFNVKRVEYIHGIGMNTDRLRLARGETDIRTELGLDKKAFVVLSIGELNTNKNQKTIIQAIAKLEAPDIHYILCGKGDQLENLQGMAKTYGIQDKVHFLGYRKDVVDICSQADVYVMPSRREGLGIAALEAMYCGMPLVTSNVQGLVDIVEDGRSGYICDPDDVEGFARSILKIKENNALRTAMGEHNKAAVRPFCIEAVRDEVFRLIKSI